MITIIDRNHCKKCGNCIGECSSQAIKCIDGDYYEINQNLCVSCGACREVCPNGAIAGDYIS